MIVFVGLMLGIFLSSLDQTIVSVCTTKIANEFNGLKQIPWIGTSYLLTSTTFQPLYGKGSDIFGRKTTFLFAILIFLIGSALCGAAQSMLMMIVARGIAGIGAGGIMSMVMIIITDIVSLRDRGKYQGIIGAVFGFSSVIGPLLGGVFTDKASWRWAFFINLPIGAITVIAVAKLLHLPHSKGSLKEKLKRVDVFGSLSLVIGLVLVLLPLNWGGSEYDWDSPLVIGLFCAGAAVLFVFCLIEWKVAQEPIIPFHMFKSRTNVAVFLTSFFIGMGLFGVMFFMPLYFQIVRQESATASGLEMLPMIVGLLLASISSGIMVSKWGQYRPFIWIGLILSTTGTGLLTLFHEDTSRGELIGYLFLVGLGIGFSMQTVMLAIQSSVETKDMAVATATATFFRTVGSVFGVAIAGTVFNNGVKSNLDPLIDKFPEVEKVMVDSYLAPTFGSDLEAQILHAYMLALRQAFLVCIPFMGLAFVFSLLIKHHKLRKQLEPVLME
ncbi:major facilitator superfamily domain-containing protein [Lobosporangium transversale]|uniref:Major facilitator superfamily domain-containing protein n=1 Tax=Lobosporangium transversale TaxID=64571 RepID=A0A1Y2GQC0_9FUNG|nr:major facilitator superfamily domain-containing protein [Lobosporangium transversale]ORZ19085.1 major facilitator superfamily domain-containing protein [Lobosporangium transversale]|eukprot:XP_021882253.1 major facilitator superfamily domain-containing protein [Lobosporangium transversale]